MLTRLSPYARLAPVVLLAPVLLAAMACGDGAGSGVNETGPGSDAAAPTPPVNAVLITLDTTRADHLGAYGHAAAETPVLDRLAAEGLLFERAWAPTPITLPSHATLFTGLPPAGHGVRNNGTYSLPASADTLAEALAGHGFATAAFVSAFVLDARFGLDQGFDHYGDDLSAGYPAVNDLEVRSRPAEATVGEAIAWLEGRATADTETSASRPFFLWLHLFDPHMPYRLEGDLARRFAARPYDGEIARADRAVGRLLEALERLGLAQDTVVVVTADHGESLGDHGEDTHGLFLYDATQRVPLILHHPASLPQGERRRDNAGLVDIAPTLLALLGVARPEAMAGRDLLDGGAAETAPLLLETVLPAESYGWSPLAGLVEGDLKYIAGSPPELYDLSRDPDESNNLWNEASGESRRLARAHRAALAEVASPDDARRAVDGEETSALRSLGYVVSSGRRGPEAGDGPDPAARAAFVQRLKRASTLVAERRFGDARPVLEALVADAPQLYDPLWMLAEVERQGGDLSAAERLFRRAAEARPDGGQARVGLGKIARARGDGAAARRWFEGATADPESDDAHLNLAVAWLDAGSPERAVQVLEEASEAFPYSPRIPHLLALVHEGRGRTREARAAVARALELAPEDAAALALRDRLGTTGAAPPETSAVPQTSPLAPGGPG